MVMPFERAWATMSRCWFQGWSSIYEQTVVSYFREDGSMEVTCLVDGGQGA